MTISARAGRSSVDDPGTHQLYRRAAQPAGQLEVVGVVRHLDRRGIGQHRIDAEHQRRAKGRVAHRPRLGDMLAQPVHRQRIERHRLLVDDLEPVMADIGDAGRRILADDDSRRDVGPAVVGAVFRDRQGRQIDGIAGDNVLMHRGVLHHDRRDALGEAGQDALEDGLLGSLEGDQRLGPRIIDAGHQGKARAVVAKQAGRPANGSTLAQRLGDLEMGCHRAIDIDQLSLLAQRLEKIAEILKRHDSSLDARGAVSLKLPCHRAYPQPRLKRPRGGQWS